LRAWMDDGQFEAPWWHRCWWWWWQHVMSCHVRSAVRLVVCLINVAGRLPCDNLITREIPVICGQACGVIEKIIVIIMFN
jgi:hypothetical protein